MSARLPVTLHARLVLERQMDDLLSMRRLYGEGKEIQEIAEILGFSKSRISRILRGQAYQAAHMKLGFEGITIGQKAGPGRPRRDGQPNARRLTTQRTAVSGTEG